jgi:ubiquinone biosynthesis accessory factor UbiJ
MLATAFVAFANHVLDPAPWAREKLSAHAGKTALFDVFPARFAIAVTADGKLQPAAPEAVPAVTIRLTHLTLLQVMAGGEEAWRKAEISAVISQVASNLRWDVEEDLSRLVGDIAAHRMAQAARVAAAWPKQAARSMAENAAEYLTEEKAVLVTPLQAAEFVREVDELRDAVERLDKRIERLSQPVHRS